MKVIAFVKKNPKIKLVDPGSKNSEKPSIKLPSATTKLYQDNFLLLSLCLYQKIMPK